MGWQAERHEWLPGAGGAGVVELGPAGEAWPSLCSTQAWQDFKALKLQGGLQKAASTQ